MVIIAVSGLHGAGKTTVTKILVKKFKQLRYVCAGDIFRQLVKERKMTLKDGSRYAELHPHVDRMIDRRISDVAREGKVLIDARLAGWMAKKADLKILLTAPIKIRIKRIVHREGRKYRDVYEETIKREKSEAKRFKKFYNIDVNNRSIFDLIINTERLTLSETTKILVAAINAVKKRRR